MRWKPKIPKRVMLFTVPQICGMLLCFVENRNLGFWTTLTLTGALALVGTGLFNWLLNRHWTPKEGGQS